MAHEIQILMVVAAAMMTGVPNLADSVGFVRTQ